MAKYKVIVEGQGYLIGKGFKVTAGEPEDEFFNGSIRAYATLELVDGLKAESIVGSQFVICDENTEPMTTLQIISAEEVK